MNRLRLSLLLCTLSLFVLVPAALAVPYDCYDTCDIEQPCENAGDDVCYECIRQWDENECLEWRETTCQYVGACGQCTVLSQWTATSYDPWQLNDAWCVTGGHPNWVQEKHVRRKYKDTYQRQRCNGVEKVVLVSHQFELWELCFRKASRACTASDPRRTNGYNNNCPF